jgi:two-component system, OmpR family, phosphate regulon sensor histidine kinase PhoR
MLVVLVLCFAVLPEMLLISVGILVLVFGSQPQDTVFGILVVSLAATLIAGIVATFKYVRRGTSLARLQSEFVAHVSHDLRTPLTSIRMFVETLQSGRLTDPDKVAECLAVLSSETERLQSMVERLLRWAKMEAGRAVYHPEPVKAQAIVDAALKALDPQVRLQRLENSVEIERLIEPDLPEIFVDPAAMTEALINVLQNALLYTGRQKRIVVRARRAETTGQVVILVEDNGPGIPKSEQSRIFEKFYRAVDPADPHVEGSGLGLAIVHHVVRAHHGEVSVESQEGKGAAFHISLPVFAGGGGGG